MAEVRSRVILVDSTDRPVGVMGKLEAHRDGGTLHRALSVFIFNNGRMLLQRRHSAKYHFPGLWTNACCSHPQPEEDVLAAAHARLREELGFDTQLEPLGHLLYHASDPASGLSEHEYDHLFGGTHDGPIFPDPQEIEELRWMEAEELKMDIAEHPERYTPWFKRVVGQVLHQARRRGWIE